MSKRILIGVVLVLLGAAFWPIEELARPRWEVVVVDQSGAPVSGITVRISWQNYSTEETGHEEDAITGTDGTVVFPAEKTRWTLARKAVGSARAATAGVHASFGPHASVFAFGKGLEGYAVEGKYVADWKGKPREIKSRIVAHPLKI